MNKRPHTAILVVSKKTLETHGSPGITVRIADELDCASIVPDWKAGEALVVGALHIAEEVPETPNGKWLDSLGTAAEVVIGVADGSGEGRTVGFTSRSDRAGTGSDSGPSFELASGLVGSTWKHLKSGNSYTVIGHCILEAGWQRAVLYVRSDGVTATPIAREVGEFLDGRFERISV